jgi:GDP-4-dehydro-6-deoxy-D-mannose reductase
LSRALITGISGFAGPYLAAYLCAQNIECVGVSREPTIASHPVSLPGLRIHDVDVRDREALRTVLSNEKPDWVFHLAAISHIQLSRTKPDLVFDVNVGGAFNLLEGLRQVGHPVRAVFVSSGNLYGNVDSGEEGFSEESPIQPASPYATSKRMGEELVRSYVEDFGLEVMIARPFNHTGPGQPPTFACPEFARAIAAGVARGDKHVEMKTGPLEPRRDISDVRDVVRAYALLAERGRPGEIYNVCSGSTVSMADVVTRLAELAHVEVTKELDPARVREREIMRSGGNCGKIRRELGWEPKIPLQDTLESLLDYWVREALPAGNPQ